jgi:hypothetical protein
MVLPPILYKYISLTPNQTPPWQDRLNMLLEGRCYLSSAADFNDPFDCLPFIAAPTTEPGLTVWKHGMAERIAESMAGSAPASFIKQRVLQAFGGLPTSVLIDKLQDAAAANAEKMGVFCLAQTINSVLMWSHYATNHQGLAVQFDFNCGDAEALLPIWKVEYQATRPMVTDMHVPTQTRPLADALAIKADFWLYEQEWRVMRADKAREVILFDANLITGLVIGAKCTPDDRRRIREIADERGLATYRMHVARRTFDLEMRPT